MGAILAWRMGLQPFMGEFCIHWYVLQLLRMLADGIL